VSPVKYKLGFYIPEDDILRSHCRENVKSYRNQMMMIKKCWSARAVVQTDEHSKNIAMVGTASVV
jgi:hypothetical protein